MRFIFARLTRILMGYIVSAFASGACVLGGATILSFIQNTMNRSGEVAPISHSIMALIFLSILLTVLGLLPTLAMGLIAEIFKIRHWSYYVMSGVLVCFVMWRGIPFQATGDFQFFLLAGALGGAVYWRIAGRHAGTWKINHSDRTDSHAQEVNIDDIDRPIEPVTIPSTDHDNAFRR